MVFPQGVIPTVIGVSSAHTTSSTNAANCMGISSALLKDFTAVLQDCIGKIAQMFEDPDHRDHKHAPIPSPAESPTVWFPDWSLHHQLLKLCLMQSLQSLMDQSASEKSQSYAITPKLF